MANSSVPQLLNPGTPLAWVPPYVEKGLTLHLDITVGSVAVLLWDVIMHIPQDYELLTEYRLNTSMLIYLFSRISAVTYCLGLVIVQTIPIPDCRSVRDMNMLFAVTFPATVLLFVLRVCALHHNRKWVVAFFSLSWIALLVSSVILSLGATGFRIEHTGYCILMKSPQSYRIAAIIPVVHDTLVFVATSWAFVRNSYIKPNVHNSFAIMFWGKYLPPFSRSILRNGQVYYLVTLIVSMIYVAITYFRDGVPPCYFGLPTFVLINNMTCLVYRNVRLGIYRDDFITTSLVQRNLEREERDCSRVEFSG